MKTYGMSKFLAFDDDASGLRGAGRSRFHNSEARKQLRRLIKKSARNEEKRMLSEELEEFYNMQQ